MHPIARPPQDEILLHFVVHFPEKHHPTTPYSNGRRSNDFGVQDVDELDPNLHALHNKLVFMDPTHNHIYCPRPLVL